MSLRKERSGTRLENLILVAEFGGKGGCQENRKSFIANARHRDSILEETVKLSELCHW